VVFEGAGRLTAADVPRPAPGPGELLLRLRGCGLCGSDIAKLGDPRARVPAVLGHEVVGDVVEAGDGVRGFGAGARVVAAPHVPCGECHYCRRGSESMCRAFKESNLDPGGFAEFVRVPAANVRAATFLVPDHLTDEEASFVEPLACCLRAVERARVQPGDTAVVVGLGSIGLPSSRSSPARGPPWSAWTSRRTASRARAAAASTRAAPARPRRACGRAPRGAAPTT
jgi:L-iditol 2-dehydrogenase